MNINIASAAVYFFGRSISICLISLPLLVSCISQKSVEYIQYSSNDSISVFREASIDNYRIKPDDELLIVVNSLDDPSSNSFLSSSGQQPVNGSNMESIGSLFSYTVDKEGFLILPVIGRLLVAGKTLTEISETITASLVKILRQPTVIVKLVNRYVSVLGEVRNPGRYAYSQEKITILDALGMAGDITDYGNRREVILLRNEKGVTNRITLNLSSTNVLSSRYFFICPNDIVYVKPLNRKFWDVRLFPYGTIISSITAAILMWSLLD